jgi:DNA-binding CsgD family transcriptional regulator
MGFVTRNEVSPANDGVALIEAPGAALLEVFGKATSGLAAALDNSTVGVEIYDVNLCCILKNKAFASMGGAPAEAHIGKSLRQIFGDNASQIEPALQKAWATGKPVSDVDLAFSLPKHPEKIYLVVNFFPIEDVDREVRLIAGLFFSATGKRRLQDRLHHLVERKRGHSLDESENPGEAFTEIAARSAEMLQESIALLQCSMSLRCHLLETRIATALLQADPYSAITAGDPRFLPLVSPPSEFVEDPRERSEPSGVAEADRGVPSPRERQVMQLLAEGKGNKEMAVVLALSTRTVEMHRARLMAKLNLHSVADLVRYAVRHNLIEA